MPGRSGSVGTRIVVVNGEDDLPAARSVGLVTLWLAVSY